MGKYVKKTLITAALFAAAIVVAPTNPALSQAFIAMAVSNQIMATTAAIFPTKPAKSQNSRLNVTADPGATRKIVFGTTAMNTDLLYFSPTGDEQENAHYVLAVAAHEVESIDEIWFEDKLVWTDAGGTQGEYVSYVDVVYDKGPGFFSISGTTWNTNKKLTGCAKIAITCVRTSTLTNKAESPVVNGLPSRVTIVGKGAILYDPRLDSTNGGSGTQRVANQATWYNTAGNRNNPALHILWFLLGWKINGKVSVGCGIPPSRIDFASFITAANICDESISLLAGGTQKRYETSGVADDGSDRLAVIQELLNCCNGALRDNGGKISLNIFKNDLAFVEAALTDSDVIGPFTWSQTEGLDKTPNACRGMFTDPSNVSLYQPLAYPTVSLSSVDGIDRFMTLDLPYVQEGRRAQRIAKQALQRAQYTGKFSATFKLTALAASVGDIVTMTFTPLGWVAKPFRVISQKIAASGLIEMTLLEENAAIYAWDKEEAPVVTPVASTSYDPLNNPFIVAIGEGGTGLTVSPSASSLVIACTSTGSPKSGELPKTITYQIVSGTTDVSDDTSFTYSVNPVNCAASMGGTNGKVLTISSVLADSGSANVTISRGGVDVATSLIDFVKVREAITSRTVSDDTLTLNTTSSYTGTQGGPLTLEVGPNGNIQLSAYMAFSSSSGSFTIYGKVQYRTTPGSGAWTDIGTEVNTGLIVVDEPGFLSINETLTPPTSATNWEFQFVNRKVGSGTAVIGADDNFTVTWSAA